MKRICVLLAAVLILCLCGTAWAEKGVDVEVMKMDGVSVVVFTSLSGIELPEMLTEIGEEAFKGISASCVEISPNVAFINARAFADCANLRQVTISANVLTIDDTALAGCSGVTIYGAAGTEAQRFAQANGFGFVDPGAYPPSVPTLAETAAVELPFVKR